MSEPALRWARVAPIVKTIDSTAGLEVARPDAVRVFRAYVGDGVTDVARVYKAILDGLKGYRHDRLYCEIINEPSQWDASVIDFAAAIVPQLHAAGLKCVLPCWSTGTPEQSVWETWRARGWAGADAIGCHLYFGKQGITPWHVGRPFRFWRPGDPPVMATEAGEDAIEDGAAGWRAAGFSPEQYVRLLTEQDAYFAQFSYFLGATVFTAAPTDSRWEPFNTDPLVDLILAGQVAPAPQPAPGGTPVPDPTADLVRKYNLVVKETADLGVRFEDVTNGQVEFVAECPPELVVEIFTTGDNGNRQAGAGHAGVIFASTSKYFAQNGEHGPWSVTCNGARVDGVGMLPDHSHPRVTFFHKSAPPAPVPTPPPASGGGSQTVNGHLLAFGFLALWRSDPARYGQPTSELLGIEGTQDLPPDRRPAFQEFHGGTDGAGLMLYRPKDGAVIWVPLPS